MRLLLGILAALVCVAISAGGFTSALVGIAEQRHANHAYVVGFVPGAGCGDAHELYLRVRDGAPLDCVSPGLSGSGRVELPGFTDEQNDEVRTLAKQLGRDGLSAADQREIQNLVDRLVTTVPPGNRLYHDYAVWGANRIWLGVGLVVAGILGLVGVLWLAAQGKLQ